MLVSGAAAGLLMAGPGGRLVMRLLAATSPEDTGRLTEQNETIGMITTEGTVGFVVFTGIVGGCATGILYALLRRWLPKGRAGGLVFGALLLVILATTLEPLRPDNRDFDVVGPGWLSVLAFSALVVAQGMLVPALAGWLSRRAPLLDSPGAAVAYLPLLGLAVLLGPVGLLAAATVMATIAAGMALRLLLPRLAGSWHSRGVTTAGRAALAAAALIALPAFAAAISSILLAG
ncbi:hypothetical protein D477_010476 [Arthrobacter crystallopoietes BAB-32]|uniref:Uncharacterized protein n=1 Tax=Arthrobacter crystallopoietes BAB-32 TaxID=1246476 RepID=N1UV32_9MICC|nr:hypothetical protein [Arthrobacter crystallopoietes]EMY34261.1 hypothetical protein D477_010476 [Arthrobacter crystallopoietes BAB-32]